MAQSPMGCIVTHGAFPNGPAHRLFDYLASIGVEVSLLVISLPGSSFQLREIRWENIEVQAQNKHLLGSSQANRSGRFLLSVFQNAIILRRYRRHIKKLRESRGEPPITLIACDPLVYALARGFFFRPWSISIAYFVDYSVQRLTPTPSGRLYSALIHWSLQTADQVWAITRSIVKTFQEYQPFDEKRHITYFVVQPILHQVLRSLS